MLAYRQLYICGREIKLIGNRAFLNSLYWSVHAMLFASVGCAKDMNDFFARRLYDSIKGIGTDDSTLIRIVATRSEVTGRCSQVYLFSP